MMRPGISDAFLRGVGVRSVTAQEARSLTGLAAAGLWIPYHDLRGEPVIDKGKPYGRLRLDTPVDARKYHQKAGSGVHAYLPPSLQRTVPHGDLVLVEGEFKSLALSESRIAAVGLSGFYAVLDGKLLPEVAAVIAHLRPARILFIGDSDTATNYQFADAAVKLAQAVAPIPVMLPRIPMDAPGKGVDDCREVLGDGFSAWWESLVDNAVPVGAKDSPASLAVRLLEREKDAIASLDGEARDTVQARLVKLCALCRKDPLAAARISGIADTALGLPKRAFAEAVKIARLEISERAKAEQRHKEAANREAIGTMQAFTGETPELVERFGQPVFMHVSKDGETCHINLNQNYWAGLFAHENDILYEPDEREFYQYEDASGLWIPSTDANVTVQLSERILRASRHPDLSQLEELRSERAMSAICKYLKGTCEQREAFARSERHAIHVLNGMLEFEGSEILLREFAPGYRSRHQIPIAFDPEARCDRFLGELVYPAMSADDADLLQRYFGSIILHTNLAQRFLILDGDAGRGKSQLANIAQGLAGRPNCAGLRTEHLTERFELYRLRRKTLLAAPDVPGRFLLSPGASILKALVGGDYLDAEGKGLNANFPMKGEFNVLITCNERLRIRIENDTGAWRRRLLIIRFEAPPPKKKIPNFAEALLAEEGAGILNWALVGADKLLREIRETGDFVLSDSQRGRVDSLLSESESLRLFVERCIERASGENVTKEELIQAYGEYCALQSWEPMPLPLVQKRLPELMLDIHQSAQARSISRMVEGRSRSTQGFWGVKISASQVA